MPIENQRIKFLADLIRETSFSIHQYLQFGHLEKVYENALLNRLSKKEISIQKQYGISVFDSDGTELGHFIADLFIEDSLIVEIKACSCLTEQHTAQLLGYLRASGIKHGMLINFGAPNLQIKKLVL